MAEHRLARLKHIFTVKFQGGTTVFQPEGLLDITGMTAETGHLDGGKHTPNGGSPLTITADAITQDDRLFLRFSHNTAPGFFFGELKFEKDGNQVVVGSFFPEAFRDKEPPDMAWLINQIAFDQQQEPWLITKP